MFRILHLSDLHFGPPYLPQVGEAVMQLAPRLKPDVIVISGDFTQRATREQFAEARQFIDALPDVPKITVPGNHDIPLYRAAERWNQPHMLYREYISDQLDTVFRCDKAVIVGLDSTAPRTAITNGRIRQRQLEMCSEAFADVPDGAVRIVVAHHHFAPAPDYLHDQTMPKARRAMRQFVEQGVELILGGHLHRAYIGNSLDFYPGNHRDRGIVIAQSGTSTSRRGRGREREKNSFNLIGIEADMFQITQFMYFEQDRQFAPSSRYLYPRPGRRFVDPLLMDDDPQPATRDADQTEEAFEAEGRE